MAEITYRLTWDPVPGSFGYTISYREHRDGDWIFPSTSGNPTLNTYYDLVLETGIVYDIRVASESNKCFPTYAYYQLTTQSGNCCNPGYTLSPDESYCYKINTTAPTVIQSDICLAPSQRIEYTSIGTRIYNPGFGTDLAGSYTSLSTVTQWKSNSSSTGPMNREGIWVDTDCNGTKDPLTAGQVLQITVQISSSVAKTVYVGMGGDNTFRLDVNGITIVDRDSSFSFDNFYYWHVVPVNIPSGISYFNFRAVGDGSVNDAFAAAIYNNNQTQLSSATSDASLDILFKTSDYIGEHIDIATCPVGYFLDTAGGSGSYICVQRVTQSTIEC